MENVICVFNLACDPRQWFCCVRERHFCELWKLKKWKNWLFPLSWAVVQSFSVLSWQRWTCFSGGGKLLTLIAKVTIITWLGGTRVFNFLLWRTCATERNWKPVLTFSQLYVQTLSSVFHSFPLLQVRLNCSGEPKCSVWPQKQVEQGQRRKSIVCCKRAFINVLKLRTPGCWATCHKIYNTDRCYCNLGWLIAYVE